MAEEPLLTKGNLLAYPLRETNSSVWAQNGGRRRQLIPGPQGNSSLGGKDMKMVVGAGGTLVCTQITWDYC